MALNSHNIIQKNDGTVWAVGNNSHGQLFTKNKTSQNTFIDITANISDVAQISCNMYSTLILKNDGTIWGAGHNQYGQMGLNNTTTFQLIPTKALNIDNVKQIYCGNYHTFALKNDGTVWAAGYNGHGQLGLTDTTNRTIFTQVSIDNVKQIACGSNYTFVLKNDGTLWSTGYNFQGQLGLNDYTSKNTFTKVDITDVKHVACGSDFTFIIKNDGTVWSTGNNTNGNLGTGDLSTKYIFTKVDIDNVKNIKCGYGHAFILKNDGTVWATGNNAYGQLGLNDKDNRNTFTQVNIDNVKDIYLLSDASIILKNDDTLWGTGYNSQGQLGLGDTTNRTIFEQANITDVGRIPDYVEIIKLFLIKSNNLVHTITENELIQIDESVINSSIIESRGVTFDVIKTNISKLPESFTLLSQESFNTNINGFRSNKQLIVAKDDFLTNIQSNIDYFKLLYEKIGNGNIKIIFSIDGGTKWKSYNMNTFIDLDITIPLKDYSLLSPEEIIQWNNAKDVISLQGIDVDILQTLDFNILGINKIRFAYLLIISDSTDILKNKNLLWQFDAKGTMQLLKDEEYDINICDQVMEFIPNITTDMIKINVL